MKLFKSFISSSLALLFILFSAAFTANPDATVNVTEWKIDPAHSKFSFEVTHFFTPVTGQFKEYTSDIHFDPDNLEESRVSIEVMVSSIDTDNQKRDGHLQSADFFNAKKYPKIAFTSDEIVRKGENQFAAIGKLTIKDVTKDIELPFKLLGLQDHPMKEGVKLAGIKANYTLDRTDYGVGVGDWAATTVVGDEVTITVALELNSKKAGS